MAFVRILGFSPFVRSRKPSSLIRSLNFTEWSICFLTVITSKQLEIVPEIIADKIELMVTQLYSYFSNRPLRLKYYKNISWHVREVVIAVT